jgi:hypothetical protein
MTEDGHNQIVITFGELFQVCKHIVVLNLTDHLVAEEIFVFYVIMALIHTQTLIHNMMLLYKLNCVLPLQLGKAFQKKSSKLIERFGN